MQVPLYLHAHGQGIREYELLGIHLASLAEGHCSHMRAATCRALCCPWDGLDEGATPRQQLGHRRVCPFVRLLHEVVEGFPGFRDQLIAIVSKSLIIKHEPRPAENIMKTKRLIKLLYTDEDTDTKWLQKRANDGHSKKSPSL